jgi:heme-degrading monooxygenase HmoA
MFARVVTGKMKVESTDEAIAIYKDSVVPAAMEQKGFVDAHLFTDPKTGKYITITVWETEEDMAAGDKSGYLQEQLGKVAAHFAEPPIIEQYVYSAQG